MRSVCTIAGLTTLALLSACSSGGSPDDHPDTTADGGTITPGCSTPMPPAATQHSLVIAAPSDLDPTANPAPTTEIFFTLMTPARCAGDAYPIVLQSHGYGGKREDALAADGSLPAGQAHFASMNALTRALPYHGYAVISFDERGHGASTSSNARIIDPRAETQDARALLDWAYDHADEFGFLRDRDTGVDKDLRVGTLGYSYGGGFQMTLAALDPRIDAIVPNGTWHDLRYSLLPGDSVKLGFGGLLCVLALTGGVSNTPLVQTLCNTIGPFGPGAYNVRSRADLVEATGRPTANPRAVDENELLTFFDTHGMAYFRRQQKAGAAWGFGESAARLRPVPALFVQGNRDVLFNLTEAYWNARYFAEAGSEVRLLSTEGGHMNPLANQVEGTADCGRVVGVESVLGWFDHHLKYLASNAYDALPAVCLSIAETPSGPMGLPTTAAGLALDAMPVGSLGGDGAVPATRATASVSVAAGATEPVFLPVTTISGNDRVLAGIPTIRRLSVTRDALALSSQSTNAFVGVGIRRAGALILVDDQLTAFTEGEHTRNRNTEEDDRVLLPGIGEPLRDGDEVGLLFYPQHVQYAAIASAEGLSGLTGVINYIAGTPIPPITSTLEPVLGLLYLNPYSVALEGIELPILVPGRYAGSRRLD